MGTRSLTYIMEEGASSPLCVIYRQMDGYPEGMGKDLYDIIAPRRLVNGFDLETDTYENAANGMGCLAATIIKELKQDIGRIYLHPPRKLTAKFANDSWAEYVYVIYPENLEIRIKVLAVRTRSLETLYEGDIQGMAAAFGFPPPDGAVIDIPDLLLQQEPTQ